MPEITERRRVDRAPHRGRCGLAIGRGLGLRHGLTLGAIALAVMLIPAADVAGQATSDPVLAAWATFPETFSCGQCHYESTPVANHRFDDPKELRRGDFSRQNEMHRWVREDKHSIARIRIEPLRPERIAAERERVIARFSLTDPRAVDQWVGASNELSQRICDSLGWEVDQPAGYQQFAAACLTCHGAYDAAAGPHPAFSKVEDLNQIQPGISCLGCHQEVEGAGAGSQAWVLAHASFTDPLQRGWRVKSPAEKSALGMRDLIDAPEQARLCADCHVGNPGQGMVITHAMYAAGHPPLPSFELETFCRSMPRHWRDEAEQLQAFEQSRFPQAAKYFAMNFPILVAANTPPATDAAADVVTLAPATEADAAPSVADLAALSEIAWNSRRMLVGAATARRRMAEQIVWAAETEGQWGDYALYDCGACHHELRRPSLRQQRGYPGRPGRPRPHEWPDVLTLLLDPTGAAVQARQQLTQAITIVPFGDPDASREAAILCIDSLDEFLRQVETQTPLQRGQLWQILERLASVPSEELVDYATARQIVWAIVVVTDELSTSTRLTEPQQIRLQAIRDEIATWKAPAPAADAEPGSPVPLGAIGITAELPAGRNQFIFEEHLGEELDRRAAYDPTPLRESLERLRKALADGEPKE